MKKNITLSNNDNQELLAILSSENTDILTERTARGVGVLLMPFVGEAHWFPLYLEDQGEVIRLMINEPDEPMSILERILEDSDDEEVWELPKDRLVSLCEVDEQAIFKIALLLNIFGADPEQILTVLETLKEQYPLERVFEELLNLPREEADRIFEPQANIVGIYQESCY